MISMLPSQSNVIECKYLLHIRAGLVVALVEHSRAQNRVEETLDRRNIVDLDLKQFERSIKNLGFKKMWKEHEKKTIRQNKTNYVS